MFNVLSAVTSKLFAVIGVIYPAGAVCTCSNGAKTLKAPDTSGNAVFAVPEAGTWTVKAVLGDKSKSNSVSITTQGQVEVVKLFFILYLRSGADLCTSTTGGWTTVGTPQNSNVSWGKAPTINGNTVSVDSYQSGRYVTNNPIDLIGFKTLEFKNGRLGNANGDKNRCWMAAWTTKTDYWQSHVGAYVVLPTAGNELRLDVSGLSGEYYIGFGLDGFEKNAYVTFGDLYLN